jgi:predicted RNA-binding Zn-ribbon protein involved in translation (DUF1610 family)
MSDERASVETGKVRVRCSGCGVWIRLPEGRAGDVSCPRCGENFRADTTARLRVPLVLAAGAAFAWALVVQPWRTGAPAITAAASLIAAGLFLLLPHYLRERQILREERPFETGFYRELGVAFLIMTATAAVFAWINWRLGQAGAIGSETATLARIAVLQNDARDVLALLQNWGLVLKLGAVLLIAAAVLLALKQHTWFDRLLVMRGVSVSAARAIAFTAACVGGFGLGAGVAGTGAYAEAVARFSLAGRGGREQVELIEARVREDLIAIVIEANESAPCADDTAQTCTNDALSQLERARQRAEELSRRWPNAEAPDRRGLSAAPPAARQTAEVGVVLMNAASFEDMARSARNEAPPPRQNRAAVNEPLWAIDTVAQQVAPATPSDPLEIPAANGAVNERRLVKLIALAISLGVETLNIELTPQLDHRLGVFLQEVGRSVTGSVQERFEELVAETAARAIRACASSGRACSDPMPEAIQHAAIDTRFAEFSRALVPVGAPYVNALHADRAELVRANDETARQLERAYRQVLTSEHAGPWGDLRRRWARDFRDGSRTWTTSDQTRAWLSFFDLWDLQKTSLAASMVREGRASTARDWDRAFLDYSRQRPDAAAAFGYMVLNDEAIHPYLLDLHPSVEGVELRVADAYLLFAATMENQSWAARQQVEAYDYSRGDAFDRAMLRMCPHAS